jgi:translation initiation factor RLI1
MARKRRFVGHYRFLTTEESIKPLSVSQLTPFSVKTLSVGELTRFAILPIIGNRFDCCRKPFAMNEPPALRDGEEFFHMLRGI